MKFPFLREAKEQRQLQNDLSCLRPLAEATYLCPADNYLIPKAANQSPHCHSSHEPVGIQVSHISLRSGAGESPEHLPKENTKNQINTSHLVSNREHPIIFQRNTNSECETQVHCKYLIPESLSNLIKQLRGKKEKRDKDWLLFQGTAPAGNCRGQKNPLEQSPL